MAIELFHPSLYHKNKWMSGCVCARFVTKIALTQCIFYTMVYFPLIYQFVIQGIGLHTMCIFCPIIDISQRERERKTLNFNHHLILVENQIFLSREKTTNKHEKNDEVANVWINWTKIFGWHAFSAAFLLFFCLFEMLPDSISLKSIVTCDDGNTLQACWKC